MSARFLLWFYIFAAESPQRPPIGLGRLLRGKMDTPARGYAALFDYLQTISRSGGPVIKPAGDRREIAPLCAVIGWTMPAVSEIVLYWADPHRSQRRTTRRTGP